jgi:selenocysteine lyase/cysteine desulfurase
MYLVAAEKQGVRLDQLRGTLQNDILKEFIAQKEIVFEETARRYEPGVLNIIGMYGMKASLEMLLQIGLENVESGILDNRDYLEEKLSAAGFEFLSPRAGDPMRSGILTTRHPSQESGAIFSRLEAEGISASLSKSHCGKIWIRFSPHFYNTINEMKRVAEIMTQDQWRGD